MSRHPQFLAGDAREFYLRRAMALMQMTDPASASYTFDDFDAGENNWQQRAVSTGALRGVTNRYPGWYEVSTGAAANSVPQATRGFLTGGNPQCAQFPAGTGGRWYLGARVVANGAFSTAQTVSGLRLVDRITITTERALLGKHAGNANWAFKGDGGGGAIIDSGIAANADALAHVLEVVRVGTSTYLFVDGVARGTPSDTWPTTFSLPALYSTNGTDAVDRSTLYDWVAWGSLDRSAS